MMKKIINGVVVMLCGAMMMSGVAFAAGEDKNALDTTTISVDEGNYGVTEIEPITEESKERGLDKPTASKNLANGGQLDFAGSSKGYTLYTNNSVTGKRTYKMYVKNRSSKTLKVTAQTNGNIFGSKSISGGKSLSYSVTVNSNSNKMYLKFSGQILSFEGNIK